MILPRFMSTLPAAGICTGLLFVGMTRMIDVQWKAGAISPPAAMDISPLIEDIKIIITKTTLEPYKRIDTPPPPPELDIDTPKIQGEPMPPAPEAVDLPPLDPSWKLGVGNIAISYADLQPIIRTPPIMPSRFQAGNHSGHCLVSFDVTPEGHTTNIAVSNCTHSSLERASRKSVEGWKFRPQIEDGLAVMARGVKNKVSFELRDTNGKVLPEPI